MSMNAKTNALRAALVVSVAAALAVWVGAPQIHAQQNQAPAAAPRAPLPQAPGQQAANIQLHVLPVQGNVSMIVGDGGNITIQIGNDGVLLVDTGLAAGADKLLDLIKQLAPDKPIRYIINTHVHADHTGGNLKVAEAGSSIVAGNFAAQVGAEGAARANIIAREEVLNRMSAPTGEQAASPEGAWPNDTYFTKTKALYFNDEPIIIEHEPEAHTDGDSFVFFRRSDVISAGDIFLTTTFPIIDTQRGGGINGIVDGLNRLIAMTVPKDKQEGGTYVIPGHGRLCDQADVVEYRDMATILRDRFQDAVNKGKTLQQVKDENLVLDYVARYGATTGFWTTDAFVTAVYNDLSARHAAAMKAAEAAKKPAPKKKK